jgi:hypothetical protein
LFSNREADIVQDHPRHPEDQTRSHAVGGQLGGGLGDDLVVNGD